MVSKMPHILRFLLPVLLSAASATSCLDTDADFNPYPETGLKEQVCTRLPEAAGRKVFVVMSLGYNNLSSLLTSDINELIKSELPGGLWNDNVLLVFQHKTASSHDYTTKTSPTLTRVFRDWDGGIGLDTLMVMERTTVSASAETVRNVLEFVKEEFPASGYGLLISSHGTGWAPKDYCTHPDRYDEDAEEEDDDIIFMGRKKGRPTPKPFLTYPDMDGEPAVKGIGVQNISGSEIIEMDITELAKAIPMKMDYIIFDACLMGGVEVAYEFRDITDMLAVSPTEIEGDGMDYKTMLSYLFKGNSADLAGFCDNYYEFYNSRSSIYRSATICLVDCKRLESLAAVCQDIFASCRGSIPNIDKKSLQSLFRLQYRSIHGWFFDMEDIIVKMAPSQEQLAAFREAMEECIIYKNATPSFRGSELPIKRYCGLSMYCPYSDRPYLNDFYRTLEWNKATRLIE